MATPRKGSTVRWKYGTGTATGKVDKVVPGSLTIQSNGKTIVRRGTPDNPAVVISQEGKRNRIVKRASELS
jgi:hypothetical protein